MIYLRKSTLPLVRQNDYQQGKTYHQFEVIRLWEQPYQPLLQAPGLLPFAILAQAEEQENLLRQIDPKNRNKSATVENKAIWLPPPQFSPD